jgi:DNA adenine methylase
MALVSPEPAPRRPALGYLSPLRYPGGKARLAPFIADLVRAQPRRPTIYAEPFAGGAGAALKLLVDEVVEGICINDLNPGIAAFWRCVFFDTDAFIRKLQRATISIPAWHRHRRIYLEPDGRSDLELGFATFFLNRCNRSGILTARPIGGLDQTGAWKLNARYDAAKLTDRIRYIGEYRDRVQVSQLDARDFIRKTAEASERVMLYVDPPYIVQGDDLYLDRLSYSDHQELARVLGDSSLQWFMTYDCDDRITDDLYPDLRCAQFNIKHTAHLQHVGSEYMVFSDAVEIPHIRILPRDDADWVVV